MNPLRYVDDESVLRFIRACELTDSRLASMSPAERDRMLQTHLAAARGPERNLQLMFEMTDFLLSLRHEQEVGYDGTQTRSAC
jgi:hypothetical protein